MTKQVTRLTVTDLIKNKEKLEVKNGVEEEIYIERLGANVVVKKPEYSFLTEVNELARDEGSKIDVDVYILYNTIVEPNLKDSELIKAFDCVEPMDIIPKLFEYGEIRNLARMVSQLAGTSNVVKKVKN